MAAIHEGLSRLHGDDKWADLTVICGGETFRLHRAVICPQSPFFEKACSGGFIEATTGQINLSEEDPHIFAKFVRFIYTGNYDDEDNLDPQHCDESVLQSVDHLTSSLRHFTEIPGLDLYDAELWNDMTRTYHSTWDDNVFCRCGSCICNGCREHDQLGHCAYRFRQRRQDLCCDGYSSDGEEYLDDTEIDGVDEGLQEGLDKDPEGYLTELPHAMLTSVRVYAMADMFCVPALKVLARNRFYKAVEGHIEPFDFADVVDEVFETTAPDDWALKDICVLFIRARCFGPHKDATLMEALQPIFTNHEDLLERIQLWKDMDARGLEKPGRPAGEDTPCWWCPRE
ncbi:uncharacterized protein B0H64DRAFT_43488 [Chaetomium fimeti]|uniref:BTB domain-containing protein n=1 Tax=Chaetomium fimeti TaxID=1854472 RepID=A0AAE0H735_9PEZI|nr:hypothetical protein B0H64DRAFT_43488 [Chaetomium fimeti]